MTSDNRDFYCTVQVNLNVPQDSQVQGKRNKNNTRSLCSLTPSMMLSLSLDLYLNVILKAGAFLNLLMFHQGRLSSENVDCTGVEPYSLHK